MSVHVHRFSIMEILAITRSITAPPAIFGKDVASILDIMVAEVQIPVTGNRNCEDLKQDYFTLHFSQFSSGKNQKNPAKSVLWCCLCNTYT